MDIFEWEWESIFVYNSPGLSSLGRVLPWTAHRLIPILWLAHADPVVSEDQNQTEENSPTPRISCSRRPYLVEPALILYYFGFLALVSLNSQYIHHRMEKDVNETLVSNSVYLLLSPYTAPAIGSNYNFSGHGLQMNASDDWVVTMDTIQAWVSSSASKWVLYLALARGLPPVFCILIILSYTDTHGRILGLALPCLGGFIRALSYVIVERYNLSISFLLIGNLADGFCGYHLTFVATSYAYLADVVEADARSFRFTLMNSGSALAGALSLVAVGHMIQGLGWLLSFSLCAAIYVSSLMYIILLLPETVVKTNKDVSMWRKCKDSLETFKVYLVPRQERYGQQKLVVSFICSALFLLGGVALVDLYALYLLGPPFYFSSVQTGNFLFSFAILGVVGSVCFVKLCQYCGLSDMTMAALASFGGFIAFTVQGLARDVYLLFLGECICIHVL